MVNSYQIFYVLDIGAAFPVEKYSSLEDARKAKEKQIKIYKAIDSMESEYWLEKYSNAVIYKETTEREIIF